MAPKLEERPYKRQRLVESFDQVITLLVGADEVALSIHKEILCDASPFFQSACKLEWMKPEESTIKLPEDDPTIIRMMLYWIYHDQICIPVHYTYPYAHEMCGFPLVLKVFIAAEKYRMPRLMNDAIDVLIKLNGNLYDEIPASIINYAYEHTLIFSPVRELMVTLLRSNNNLSRVLDTQYEALSSEPKSDLVNRLWGEIKGESFQKPEIQFCEEYHTHDDRTVKDFLACKTLKCCTFIDGFEC